MYIFINLKYRQHQSFSPSEVTNLPNTFTDAITETLTEVPTVPTFYESENAFSHREKYLK